MLYVFREASRARLASGSDEPARSQAPASAARFVVVSELAKQECVNRIRNDFPPAAQADGSRGQVRRGVEVADTGRDALSVLFHYRSAATSTEQDKPNQFAAWLIFQEHENGCAIRLAVSSRTRLGLIMARWVLPAVIVVSLGAALLVPYVRDPSIFVGILILATYIGFAVVSQILRPRLIREYELFVRLLARTVDGEVKAETGRRSRRPFAIWNDVRADDVIRSR